MEKEDVLDILDNKWITNFEKEDELYQDFYIDDNYFVHLHFIYIHKNMEIEKIREETFFMKTPNIISREEIIGLLKKNAFQNKQKYSIFSLLKFNIHLKPQDIPFFLQNSSNTNTEDFLKPIKHIDTVTFEKTISMFQDLNTLYFIYVENRNMDVNTKKNLTKKIYLHFLKENQTNKVNKVNKVNKKTKRKYY
jgi:hypothetical protein